MNQAGLDFWQCWVEFQLAAFMFKLRGGYLVGFVVGLLALFDGVGIY